MATSVTIKPNATLSQVDAGVIGAATHHEAVDEDFASMADYVYDASVGGGFQVTFGMGDITLPANKRIGGVRIRCGTQGTGGTEDVLLLGWLRNAGGSELLDVSAGYTFEYVGGYHWVDWTGTEWTEADVDDLRVRFQGMSALSIVTLIWACVDVLMHTKPVPSITFPTGLTSIWHPAVDNTVHFNINSDGDAGYRQAIKIFTTAVAEGGGFNPESSANLYSTVEAFDGNHVIPASLGLAYNTSYYVYVKLSTNPSFLGEWFGDWVGIKFKTVSKPVASATAPSTTTPVPSLAWGYSDADGRAQARAMLRIYERPGGSWAGFDINTTSQVPIYSATDVDGSPHAPVGIALQNGINYRYYLRVSSLAGPDYVDSDWDFEEWTTNFPAPGAPTLSITSEPALARLKIDIFGHTNLLTANQASLETDTSGYTTSNCSLTRVNTDAAEGTWSAQLTATGAGNMHIQTPSGTSGFVVAANKLYSARASYRAATTGRTVELNIIWYDLFGAPVGTSTTTSTDTTGAYQEKTLQATSPASAVFANLQLRILSAAAAEVHRIDKMVFAPGIITQVPWGPGGLSGANLKATLDRSPNGTDQWTRVRGATDLVPDAYQQVTVYDYEAPFNDVTFYRAFNTSLVISSPSSSAYGTGNGTLVVNVLWLKDPLDPTRNRHFLVQNTWLSRSHRKRRVHYEALGRTKPIPFRDAGNGERLQMGFLTLSDTDMDALELLLDSNRTLLLQSARRSWYVDVAGDFNIGQNLWDEKRNRSHAQQYQVPFIEVDAP